MVSIMVFILAHSFRCRARWLYFLLVPRQEKLSKVDAIESRVDGHVVTTANVCAVLDGSFTQWRSQEFDFGGYAF